jgi:hypothetical protein
MSIGTRSVVVVRASIEAEMVLPHDDESMATG